ncbi:MAG: hypothetical protein ACK47B_23280 [Armatimonadota bacterium]
MFSPLPQVARRVVPLALLALTFLLPGAAAGPDPLPFYTVTLLGTLGGETSEALSINERGQVVGKAETADGETHAFLWEYGGIRDLGTLPGGSYSEARDINRVGDIVGVSTNADGYRRATYWSGDEVIDVGTLGGNNSWANAIDDNGELVGAAERAPDSASTYWPNYWAFRSRLRGGYPEWRMVALPQLHLNPLRDERALFSEAFEIRNGLVLGHVFVNHLTDTGYWPLTWKNNQLWIGRYGKGWFWPRSINRRSQVVGQFSGHSDETSSWITTLKGIRLPWPQHDIRPPSGSGTRAHYPEARGINDAGTVVGSLVPREPLEAPPVAAFIYRSHRSTLLSPLVPRRDGWKIVAANAINDRGQIVGQAEREGRRVACLLTPVRSGGAR